MRRDNTRIALSKPQAAKTVSGRQQGTKLTRRGEHGRRSLRGVVLTNLAIKLPRRPPAKAREARFVDEGGVVAIFWLN